MRGVKVDRGTLVMVLWHDAEASHGWQTEEESLSESEAQAPALSVGWVVDPARKTKMGPQLVLCADKAEDDIHPNNRRLAIPHGMVIQLREVGGSVLWPKPPSRGVTGGKRRSPAPSVAPQSDPVDSGPRKAV